VRAPRLSRWARVGIAAATLGLALLSCAPQRTEDNGALLKLKSQCQEAGEKARAEWVAKYDREHFSETPEYAYNESLHTCLYADSYWDTENLIVKMGGGNMVEVRFILDVYTNKTLIEYTAYDGKPIEGSPSEAKFEAEKRRLMGGPPSAQGHVP
jgi:hypothetical protein